MSTVWRFLTKFANLLVCTLHCFDRVIFKGHLAMASPRELERFVAYVLKVRRSEFIKVLAPRYGDRLVEHAQRFATKAGRTDLYRTDSFRKDHWAQQRIREQRLESGWVGILCTQETCNAFKLVPGDHRPRFVSCPRAQRVLYYYFLAPQLGLIHVRLQTWAPFTLQVYVHGHDFLAQQMVRLRLGFVQQHNAFTQLDEPAKANGRPTVSHAWTGRRSWAAMAAWSIRSWARNWPATGSAGWSIKPSSPPTSCSSARAS